MRHLKEHELPRLSKKASLKFQYNLPLDRNTPDKPAYPVVDLFAGPGGLGEGFSGYKNHSGKSVFKAAVSIERDKFAFNTLLLRHFFRSFEKDEVPEEYYQYLSQDIHRDELIRLFPSYWDEACSSVFPISLGPENHETVRTIIERKIRTSKKWVLVGGPPCQAYSIVGRSRRMNDPAFEADEKHFLYKEYLKIIIDHKPPVFVMENVRGLISATVKGKQVIKKIIKDLTNPKSAVLNKNNGLSYRLFSLNEKGEVDADVTPSSFVVEAEKHGVPQSRHRMFIVGIRSDLNIVPEVLRKNESPPIKSIIGNMPRIRSGLSRGKDSSERWRDVIKSAESTNWFNNYKKTDKKLAELLQKCTGSNARLPVNTVSTKYTQPKAMADWYVDDRLKLFTSHEARFHMETDLHRYLFAASFSKTKKISPKLCDFPEDLLPNHKNVEEGRNGKMFGDRFKVQLPDKVSTTITSHMAKDGHYFIHYDPSQCRSLTVREAARLQTFPDNYYFEGPRTAQYSQVGNAVPPFLAAQIAEIIEDVLSQIPEE